MWPHRLRADEPLPTTFASDLAGADAICAEHAAAGGLPGTYVAWLSTSTIAARDRLSGARGWSRVDGRPVADRVDDLVADRILHPIRIDEHGLEVPSAAVATGTRASGALAEACADFTEPAGNVTTGDTTRTHDGWTSASVRTCATPVRLYCFGVDVNLPLTPTLASGRRAFLTAQQLTPGGGLAAADQLCNEEATLGGLSGTFRALLGTASASPASRFSLTGAPWVRADGILLADTPFLFMNGALHTTLGISSTGLPVDVQVFTGASSPLDGNNGFTCTDWTSTGGTATYGLAKALSIWFDISNAAPCSEPRSLYCLEE